ncbi:flavin oxidoreductase [Dokdonia pacifica]|uniref:NADH-FMN oxidoreductase RutF, flavin reductase (DIM6/NTAB) family n=1 Tax=Dokdonia pacifica TaxID=1627892 RepID=A0A239A746_9FLAO|nr:flavin reductase [Dokdonia pacifica]GGG35311.1 flavin oxidoreductase [Dokdonia pacifica]SNR91447.1 NADH-FMN oxidoreductase RutF, flavin reductase (DIM6/NTAB) family [Dokdonia pacifica]
MRKILHFDIDAIEDMDTRFRANFINSVTGYKSANLLGTIDQEGVANLAVFSSITHLGSHPPLVGFITRPTVVPRHTYLNIKESGFFTINHITSSIVKEAHQTSARYDASISEFDATGLTSEFKGDFKAPFVKEAPIKIACRYVNEYPIKENGTVLVVGAMQDIYLPEGVHTEDGWIDLSKTEGVTINGLDSYSKPQLLDRLQYAKPDKPTTSILKK